MTRIAFNSHTNPEAASISLTRLLSRLEERLFLPENAPELARNPYLRTKLGVNLEYARSLVLRLEHDSSAIKVQSRKQSVQADLQTRREQITRLSQRLQELNQLRADWDDEEEDEEEVQGEEDHEAEASPSLKPARPKSSTVHSNGDVTQPTTRKAKEDISSGLRSRRPGTREAAAASATGVSVLFPPNFTPPKSSTNMDPDPNLSQSEALLSHNRREQENISEDLLQLAQRLKVSSLQFQSTLLADRDVVDRASAGLDKNATGMESAGRKMGALRRMSEGKGWWARLSLYAKIGVLWVVALVIVFVLPKLRF